MIYPFIFYRKTGHPGSTKGPFIWLREDMRGSVSVLQHELVHVRQWLYLSLLGIPAYLILMQLAPQYALASLLSVALHANLYVLIPAYRLWSETEAFKAQVKHGGDLLSCAQALSTGYKLNITADQAVRKLQA